MRGKKIIIGIVIVAILGVGGLTASKYLNNKAKQVVQVEAKLIPVTVETVKKGSLEKTISLGGLLKPQNEVFLVSKNPAAKISSAPIIIGDRVEAGTPLIYFDGREIDIQLNQAEIDYDRNEQLFQAGALSKYQLEQSQNMLANLRIQKENMVLFSPINGIVASLNAVPGQLSGSAPLASVVNIDKLKLEVQIGEAHISKMQTGAQVVVIVPSVEQNYNGIITSVPPQVNAQTKAYHVTLEIDNTDGLIKGGMYGEVHLVVDKKENILVIPQYAIVDFESNKVVYVVENGKAVRKTVTVGLTVGDMAEILSGLSQGDSLIVEGQYGVIDGTAVSPATRSETK